MTITKDEAESLLDFIECYFIDTLKDNDVDNMKYVYNICSIWRKCKDEQ